MAGVGNKIRLKDGTIGTIKKVTNGNYLLITAEGKPRWCTPDDIDEVL